MELELFLLLLLQVTEAPVKQLKVITPMAILSDYTFQMEVFLDTPTT